MPLSWSNFFRQEFFQRNTNIIFLTEIKVRTNNILASIPVLSPEWSISLDIRRDQSIQFGVTICSVIQLRADGTEENYYGNRTPFIGIKPETKEFHIASAINGEWNERRNVNGLSDEETHHIEIHQKYFKNGGGKYRYSVQIDGEEVVYFINTDARQFYNVNVYASNPYNDPCPVYISNLKITNFL